MPLARAGINHTRVNGEQKTKTITLVSNLFGRIIYYRKHHGRMYNARTASIDKHRSRQEPGRKQDVDHAADA